MKKQGGFHLGRFIGHYGELGYVWMLGASAAWNVLVSRDWALGNLIFYALFAVSVVCLSVSAHYHDSAAGVIFSRNDAEGTIKVCELCAASFPLDAAAQAERYQKQLRFAHLVMRGNRSQVRHLRFIIFWLAILMTPSWVARAFFDLSDQAVSLVSALTFTLPFAYAILSVVRHRNFSPWCPVCRRGPGDDEEVILSPDPSPASR